MVSCAGLEPATPSLKVKCSTDWANKTFFKKRNVIIYKKGWFVKTKSRCFSNLASNLIYFDKFCIRQKRIKSQIWPKFKKVKFDWKTKKEFYSSLNLARKASLKLIRSRSRFVRPYLAFKFIMLIRIYKRRCHDWTQVFVVANQRL